MLCNKTTHSVPLHFPLPSHGSTIDREMVAQLSFGPSTVSGPASLYMDASSPSAPLTAASSCGNTGANASQVIALAWCMG